MFLIYINDLVKLLRMYNITVKLFADDVKLYVKVVNTTDTEELQSALTTLVQWAEDWQLSVSVDKCCVLTISKSCTAAQFYINNTPLPVVDDCRDLGINNCNERFITVKVYQ